MSDAETLAQVCAALQVSEADVRRGGKRPAAVAARRVVVRTLHAQLGWSWGRIGQALGRDKKGLWRLAAGK